MTTVQQDIERILNSATLVMGVTKSGKSSLLATAAEYVWEVYRKQSRLYSCDGGGFPMQMQSLINVGIVEVWRMRTRSAVGLAHETCQRAAMGYWPARINPKTGETDPAVRLVAPLTQQITMRCPNGHDVKTVPFESLLTNATCPTCKTLVTKQNMTTARTSHQTKGFEHVGALLLDGLTSMLSWGIDDLTDRTGRQELVGEKSALGGVVQSGELSFAGTNRAQYGFMQKRAEALVTTSNAIPNLVIPPIWTALTTEGTEEGGLRVRGPLIIGQAKTAEAGQWFGDTMETLVVETNDGKKFRRLHLQQYVDKDGVRHLCGVRSFPTLMPSYLEDEETDKDYIPFQNFSLGTFYRLRDEARAKTEEVYRRKYPDAPGVPEGIVEIGEPVVETPAPAIAPAAPRPAAAPAAAPRPKAAAPKATAAATTPQTTPAPAPAAAPAAATTPIPPVRTAGEAASPGTTTPAATTPPAGPIPIPVASPAAPKPPTRGPSAPPPGRRPTPAPAVSRPAAVPPK